MSIDYGRIGIRIKRYRLDKHLKQEQLGELIHSSTATITAIERGVKAPSVDTLISIANTLEVSADDILTVLDLMDDYLEEQGLVREDPETGEMEYLEGDVDETEQLNYVLKSLQEEGRAITGVQIQLIQDAELQFGIQKGYYSEE